MSRVQESFRRAGEFTKGHAESLALGALALGAALVEPSIAQYTGVSGGVAIGIVEGYGLHQELARQRQALIAHAGPNASGLVDPRINIAPRVSRVPDWRSPVVGAMAVVYGMAGGFIGQALKKDEAPAGQPPRIEYVAPMSGTMSASSLKEVIKTARLLAEKNNEINAEAVVAANGHIATVRPEEVGSQPALGEAPLSDAIEAAFDQVRIARAAEAEGDKTNAALLVATDGKNVGPSAGVIAAANKATTRTPVYVVNVGKETGSGTAASLQKIADQTGGEYMMSVDGGDIDRIAERLESANVRTPEGDGTGWGSKVLAALALAGAAFYRLRVARYQPLRYHGSNN